MHTKFSSCNKFQYPLEEHNSNLSEVKQKKYELVHQSKDTQFIGYY